VCGLQWELNRAEWSVKGKRSLLVIDRVIMWWNLGARELRVRGLYLSWRMGLRLGMDLTAGGWGGGVQLKARFFPSGVTSFCAPKAAEGAGEDLAHSGCPNLKRNSCLAEVVRLGFWWGRRWILRFMNKRSDHKITGFWLYWGKLEKALKYNRFPCNFSFGCTHDKDGWSFLCSNAHYYADQLKILEMLSLILDITFSF
jgi:hypothetical protein